MTPEHVEHAARMIFESVWAKRAEIRAQEGPRGARRPLIVLAGYELWESLRKRPETDLPESPWSCRDGIMLRVVDVEVHSVDVPLVANLTAWRLVRDAYAH